jgi:hypothetical protein
MNKTSSLSFDDNDLLICEVGDILFYGDLAYLICSKNYLGKKFSNKQIVCMLLNPIRTDIRINIHISVWQSRNNWQILQVNGESPETETGKQKESV